MSSTDKERLKRLRQFWSRQLAPAIGAVEQRGVPLMRPGATPDAESWYVPFRSDEPDFVEIETDRIHEALVSMWRIAGVPELADLAGPLVELAKAIEPDGEESSELSSDIYAMY